MLFVTRSLFISAEGRWVSLDWRRKKASKLPYTFFPPAKNGSPSPTPKIKPKPTKTTTDLSGAESSPAREIHTDSSIFRTRATSTDKHG